MNHENKEELFSNSYDPLVSVILCSYNAVQFIGEAINSILNQTFHNFELIIIDDGSSDGTRAIVESYKDPRIKYFPMEKNMGIVHARNFAINLSKGAYIALMDHDDISHPDRLMSQIDHLERTQSDICSTFHFDLAHSSGKIRRRRTYTLHSDIKALLVIYTPLINPSVMVSRKVFQYSLYKKEYEFAEDYALWCDLALAGQKFTCCPKYLFTYRVHDAQMTQTKIENNKNLSESIREHYIKNLMGNKYELPDKLSFSNRLKVAIPFMMQINKIIPGISLSVNYEIYARYQFRGNGMMTPFVRLERFLIASLITMYGFLA